MSSVQPLIDAAGRRRSPATMPEFRAGKPPRNKGQRYPADPPTVEEIVAVMRQAQRARYGHRLTGLIVVLWRAGLRINEALSLTEDGLLAMTRPRLGRANRDEAPVVEGWCYSHNRTTKPVPAMERSARISRRTNHRRPPSKEFLRPQPAYALEYAPRRRVASQ
jgi:hypothetical protein